MSGTFCWNCGRACGGRLCNGCIERQRQSKFRDLAAVLCTMPQGTLWCVGSMEDGPFARLCYPMPGGHYLGGYVEESGDTPADALRTALAAGAQRAETNEDLAQSEGRQSGDAKQRNAQPPSDRIEQLNQGGSK